MLKIALCDDDAVFLKELTGKIQELLRFEEKNAAIASFVNPTALTASVASGDRFDIFILDVEMPQIDGFKVAADLRKYQPNVALIFLTSHLQYAPEGYIKTDVGYVQITYAEFCRIRNTTENYKASHWFIPVQGVLLEVPKDAYKAFYREKERERYLRKLDSALFLCNLDLKSEEIPLRDENTDIEQQTEDRLMIEKMYSCLHLLDPDDAEFIRMYFFQHVSRKELAKKYGVHPSNISRKAAKILEKLKKLMEK